MIIGYGASGSGKTSTLINFFDKNLNVSNPGIMMYMSDKLQSEYN
jgi:ABC-type lipoprotein export system ATPase subunit